MDAILDSFFFTRIAIPPKNKPQEKKLRYAAMPKYQALQLPYNDRQTLATILLPKDFSGLPVCPVKFGWRFPIKVGRFGKESLFGKVVVSGDTLCVFLFFLAGSGHGNEKWMDLGVFLGKPKGITLKKVYLFCLRTAAELISIENSTEQYRIHTKITDITGKNAPWNYMFLQAPIPTRSVGLVYIYTY